MKVTATNALGKTSEEIWFNPGTNAVPHAPEKLQVIPQDGDSYNVTWKSPSDWWDGFYFLDFELQYKTEWEENIWQQLALISYDQYKEDVDLEANTLYTFRVSCRIHTIADAGWSPWSDTATIRTAESAPIEGVQLHLLQQIDNYSDNTRTVTMGWTLPPRRQRKGIIKGYKIEVIEERNPTNTQRLDVEDGNVTIVTIQDLDRFKSYQVTVIAFNSAGNSPPASFRILDQISAPGAPVITNVYATSEDSIFVSWDPPENGNGQIIGYELAYAANDEVVTTRKHWERIAINGNKNTYHVRDLEAFVRYEFKVQARNSLGFGGYSQTVTQYTAEGVPSGPPINITLQAIAEFPTSLEAEWNPPNPHERNGIILAYQITMCGHTDNTDDDDSISCEGRNVTMVNYTVIEPHSLEAGFLPVKNIITGLTPNTQYAVSISAITALGIGPGSDFVITKTSIGAPERPLDVEIPNEMVNGSELTVRWTMSDMMHDGISHYEITLQALNNSKHCPHRIVNTNNTWVKIDNLCGYETYEIMVKACSIAMIQDPCGSYSDPVYATTLVGVPSQPMEVRATPMDNSKIKVTWSPPERPNGPIDATSYNVNCYSGNDVISEGHTVFTETVMSAECDIGFTTDPVTVTCQVQSSMNQMKSASAVSNEVEICFEKEIWPYVILVIGAVLGVGMVVICIVCCRRVSEKMGCFKNVSHVKPLWETEVAPSNRPKDDYEVFDSLPKKRDSQLEKRASFRTLIPRSQPETQKKRTFLRELPNVEKESPHVTVSARERDGYIPVNVMDGNGDAKDNPSVRSPLMSTLDEDHTMSNLPWQNTLLSKHHVPNIPNKVCVPSDGIRSAGVGQQPPKSFACAINVTETDNKDMAYEREMDVIGIARGKNAQPKNLWVSRATNPEEYQPFETLHNRSSLVDETAFTGGSSVQSTSIGSCEGDHSAGIVLEDSIATLLGNSSKPEKSNLTGVLTENLEHGYLPLDIVGQGNDGGFDSSSESTTSSDSTCYGSDQDDVEVENAVPLLAGIPGHPHQSSSAVPEHAVDQAAIDNNETHDCQQVDDLTHKPMVEAVDIDDSPLTSMKNNGAKNNVLDFHSLSSSSTDENCLHANPEDYQATHTKQQSGPPAGGGAATTEGAIDSSVSTVTSENLEVGDPDYVII